jgi:hypothetical protein
MKKFSFVLLTVLLAASFVVMPAYADVPIGPRLIAGQNMFAAGIKVEVVETDLLVHIDMRGGAGWCLKEAHLHVGQTLQDFPFTKSGNLKLGQFDYKRSFDGDCVGGRTTFIIPLARFEREVFIAIHAVVVGPDGQEETAWGARCGDLAAAQFPGANWAAYIWYQLP